MALLPDQAANGDGARVKICGLTRVEDLRACVQAGADAVGLNLAAGPRRIAPEQAAELAHGLPDTVTAVLLVMDRSPDEVRDLLETVPAQAVQLHGVEPPAVAATLREHLPVIKAFRVRDAASLDAIADYPCDIALLDAWVPGVAGGTSTGWDHRLLAGREFGKPVMLAGGLRPANVGEAVAATGAWAVDTASGVESSPGIKDAAAIAAFVAAARGL